VIPAYNAAKFIDETLTCILEQTLEGVEVIVVDDGSTDSTANAVEPYLDHITYIHQENAGVSAARNRGLEPARGRYVCFFDADDWMYPENLAKKVAHLEGHPEDVLVHSHVAVTDEVLNRTGEVLTGRTGDVAPDLMGYAPPAIPGVSSSVLRTEIARAVGGFDTELSTSADFDFWVRVALRGTVASVPEVLVFYRRHGEAMYADVGLHVHDMLAIIDRGRQWAPDLDWRGLESRFRMSVSKHLVKRGRLVAAIPHIARWLFCKMRSRADTVRP
jgi:glycosyltransferase involved in cell wall biosynthesis